MDHTVTGIIVHVDDVRHSEDAGQGHLSLPVVTIFRLTQYDALHLIGEGCHCDPLPGAGDQGCGAGGEVTRVKSATCHVSQEDGLQSYAVSQEGLEIRS